MSDEHADPTPEAGADYDAQAAFYKLFHAANVERIEHQQHQHAAWQRRASWSPAPVDIRRPNTAPRQDRATRATRTNTARRTAAMAGSASRSSDGGGGDEPPDDPAPLGAEGRATECPLNLGPTLPGWFISLWEGITAAGGLVAYGATEDAAAEAVRLALESWTVAP